MLMEKECMKCNEGGEWTMVNGECVPAEYFTGINKQAISDVP